MKQKSHRKKTTVTFPKYRIRFNTVFYADSKLA